MDVSLVENMRECVKDDFLYGIERGLLFHKKLRAIISELRRVGLEESKIKDELIEWNKRCDMPYGIAELRRSILEQVDWVFKHNFHIGCHGLKEFCKGEANCFFFIRTSKNNRDATKELPFDMKKAEAYLGEYFRAHGLLMLDVLKTLQRYQLDMATGEIMYIGIRGINTLLRDQLKYRLDNMTIHRVIQTLDTEGFIEIAVRGKPGVFRKVANGYRFLPWEPPKPTNNPK